MVEQLKILNAKKIRTKTRFSIFIILDEVPKGASKVVLRESGKVKNLKFRLFGSRCLTQPKHSNSLWTSLFKRKHLEKNHFLEKY